MRVTGKSIDWQLGLRALVKAQDGAVAAILALLITVLVGAVALAMDLGRAWNLSTELQHAADAAALAGASQLDNKAGARARAIQAAAGALAQNSQTFATDGNGATVTIDGNADPDANSDILFLVDLTTRAVATNDQEANFIQVTVSPRTVDYAFAAVLGALTSASPTAVAVAGMGMAHCKVPPLMICNPFEDPVTGGGDFIVEDHIGKGIILKAGGSSSPWAPGNFGLLALDNSNLSTNDVRDAMGRVNPLALCFGDTVGSKPGQATAVAQGLNVRFDIYEGAAGGLQSQEQYQPAANAIKGLVKAGPQCSFNATGGNGWTKPADPYEGPNDTSADAMGFPRDNCAYPAPGGPGTCLPTTGGRVGDGVWDFARYMEVNHGSATPPADLAAAAADPTAITRYEVYQWELGEIGTTGSIVDNSIADPVNGENANPQCYSGPALGGIPNMPDRRLISVAVINCVEQGVAGNTPDLDVLSWVDLFLTEPMGVFDGNNDLYGEIAKEADPGSLQDVVRYIVQLYE